MGGAYFGFVASAYAIPALALMALGAWTFLDARAARRDLKRLEESGAARRRGGER
ncbi:heme exporter protein CcmD [Aureimonas mangrovi]|uniref:heme exporter protein CcmD n=1 Tax=Aureimonas mangrovi TaxID=2758041 RepID=UPI00163DC68B|nr:heme exporter protein CcmD [Aureimonas mangrovi]